MIIIALICLGLSAASQVIFGNRSVNGKANINLFVIFLAVMIIHIAATYFGIITVSDSLQRPDGRPACGMPIVGFLVLSISIFVVTTVVFVVQLLLKHFRKTN